MGKIEFIVRKDKVHHFLYMSILMMIWAVGPLKGQNSARVDSLNERSAYFRDVDMDSSFLFGKQALDLSRQLGLKDKELTALYNLCNTCFHQHDFKKSAIYCRQVIEFEGVNKNSVSDAFIWDGLSNINLGFFNKALESFLQYVEIPEIINYDISLADGLSNIGLAYLNEGNITKAASYYRSAMRIHERINHPYGLGYIYQNYGRVLTQMSKYDSAKFYFDAALIIADKMENQNIKYWVYTGIVNLPQLNNVERKAYWVEALKVAVATDMGHEIGAANYSIGTLLLEADSLDESLNYFNDAINFGKKMGDYGMVLSVYNRLASAMVEAKRIEESQGFIEKYEQLNDSLSNHKSDYVVGVLKAQNSLAEERDIDQIKDKLAASEAEVNQNQLLLYAVIAGLFLIGIILVMYIRWNRVMSKANQKLLLVNNKLDAAMKEKDLLTGMIVHDIRSPFNNIEALMQLFKMSGEVNEDQKQIMTTMLGVVEDSKTLTNDLLEINKIEAGQIEIRKDSIIVEKFVTELLVQFELAAHKKDIELVKSIDLDSSTIISSSMIVKRIFENLISNAIKYSDKGGKVIVDVSVKESSLLFNIKDNGQGISLEEQELLFKKFGRASSKPSGKESSTGLGLYIVDQMINNLNGQITLKSELGKGAEFKVEIPIQEK